MSELIHGIHSVNSLLTHKPETVSRLLFDENRSDKRLQQLLELAREKHITCHPCKRKQLDEMSQGQNHQGVIAEAVAVKPHQSLESLLDNLDEPAFLLVLDGITDPHNLGACLRTADAAGVHAVIYPKDKSASINATVRKVACGAADVIPTYAVTNLARCLEQLKQRGIWITGTAGESSQSLYETDLTGPLALVMGAEGKGMRRLTREHCDFLARLPMAGSVSSLNVSVATGICLFEAKRQRNSGQ